MIAAEKALNPIQSRKTLDDVMKAIASIDSDTFASLSEADDVGELSSNTVFDSIETSPETVFQRPGGRFEASAIVYVTLNYGGKRDGVSMPDSYPAVIEGKISGKKVEIERIRVDTSSFYG